MTREEALAVLKTNYRCMTEEKICPRTCEGCGLAMQPGELEEAIRVAIKTLEPKTGHWIPVSDRLPERYKEVIVTDIETSDTYQSQYIGNGYWECDNGTLKNRIIAWMPLPKPYEPQEREDKDADID